jgi:hypothetical protein
VPCLSGARRADENAARADVGQLALTHLRPGSDAAATITPRTHTCGHSVVAVGGLIIDLG